MARGVILVSHTKEMPEGLKRLISEVAKDVPVTTAGGLEDGSIGTSMERISKAIEENTADELLAFYDLGSAKMNLEMAMEMTDKKVTLFDTAFVESAYTACALLAADADEKMIEDQLASLKVK